MDAIVLYVLAIAKNGILTAIKINPAGIEVIRNSKPNKSSNIATINASMRETLYIFSLAMLPLGLMIPLGSFPITQPA